MAEGFTLLILAAQRAGVENPLAKRVGVSHKCLVTIAGNPLIVHVLDTVTTIGTNLNTTFTTVSGSLD
jgi:GTP:adenosylcobinamide-phosphate guanylyltransferase